MTKLVLLFFGVYTNDTNGTGTYVAYCFAEIAGYSKFGKFIGNNVMPNGTFVYLGFKPAFLIAKRADSTSDWFILDNKRTPTNVVGGGGIGQTWQQINLIQKVLYQRMLLLIF